MSDADAGSTDLRGLVTRGVGWMMASQGTTQVLAFATSVVIARFMAPREVGLATEATVFATLALVVVDLGFGAAVIQRPKLTDEDASTAFWAGLVLGGALTLAGIGLSWPIASLFGEPRVQGLFAVLSLVFLIEAPGIVPGALLTRELRFRSLETRTIVATGLSCVVAMVLAILGFGAWAIVAQSLTIAGVSTVLLWRTSRWRPRATVSRTSLRQMSRYGGHVFGARALSWANLNVDNLLVGRFLGPTPLGEYSIAFSVGFTPVMRVATPITQVFFPAFSRIGDPVRIGEIWLRAVRMLAAFVVPAMLGLIVVAPEFIDVLFGPKWRAAIPVIQIMAPIGLMQSLTTLNAGVLQSVNRTHLLFRWNAVIALVSVAAFAAGIPGGIKGVAIGYLCANIVLQPLFVLVTTRTVRVRGLDWASSVANVFAAGAVMALLVLGARELLVGAGVPAAARLVVSVLFGVVVYVGLVAWWAPRVKDELRMALRRSGHAADAATDAPSGIYA